MVGVNAKHIQTLLKGIKLEISHIICYTRANLHCRMGQEIQGEE